MPLDKSGDFALRQSSTTPTAPVGPRQLGGKYGSLIENKPFVSLWISQLISQSGDYILNIALLWFVLSSTKSVFLVGITQAAAWTPIVVAGPLAGVYVDKLNRKKLILFANIFQGIIVGAMSLIFLEGFLSFTAIIPFLLVLFSVAQFLNASVNAMIPNIVKAEQLSSANGLFSFSSSINQLGSSALGGIIVVIAGVSAPLLYDSITFFIAASIVSLFVGNAYGDIHHQSELLGSGQPVTQGFFYRLREGFDYVRKSRLLVEIIVVGGILNFFVGAAKTLLSPYSEFWLGGSAATFGLISGLLGLGAIGGSLLFGKMNARRQLGRLFFCSVVIVGGSIIFLGISRNVIEALFFSLILGSGTITAELSIQVLVQAKVDSNLLGRVYTMFASALNVTAPFSAIVGGTIGGAFPVGWAFVAFGAVIACVGVITFAAFSELRGANY